MVNSNDVMGLDEVRERRALKREWPAAQNLSRVVCVKEQRLKVFTQLSFLSRTRAGHRPTPSHRLAAHALHTALESHNKRNRLPHTACHTSHPSIPRRAPPIPRLFILAAKQLDR